MKVQSTNQNLSKKLLHEKAVTTAQRYRRAEIEMIEVIQEIDQHKVFLDHECTSVYGYVTKILGLSEDTALSLIQVARKSVQVPALKEAIRNQEITVSKARKITSVLTPENQDTWIQKAIELPRAELEREVAKVNPQTLVQERAKFVAESRLELKVGISEELMKKLKRIQDLVSQQSKKAASYEDALEKMAEAYLEKYDPLRRAERAQVRVEKKTEPQKSDTIPSKSQSVLPGKQGPGRILIPAALAHQIRLRDQSQCTHHSKGIRCEQKRWLDLHHIVSVSQGGANSIENLTTLCSAHHRMQHQ